MRRGFQVLGGLLLIAAVALLVDRQLHLPSPPPGAGELEALSRRRDALGQEFRETVAQAGEKSLGKAPRAGIMIGIPTGYARSIVEQIVTGLFAETTLTLRNLKVHKEGEVKAKVLLRKKAVGGYVLDVEIHDVRGVLRPGRPELAFGDNLIRVALPVALAEGEGRARLRLAWDSKGLAANLVCGDVDIDREVTGRVVPEDYRVTGLFGISTTGSSITLRPDFGELAVRIYVDPTEQAWKVVDEVVAEQNAACRKALEKIDLKKILGKLLGKGFNVKIPKKIFKPIRLPAGVSQSLDVQGVRLDLTVKGTGLVVSDDRLWYGADLRAERKAGEKAGASGAAPVPSGAPDGTTAPRP